MALQFDKDFEAWLDDKLLRIKSLGKQTAQPLIDFVSKREDTAFEEPDFAGEFVDGVDEEVNTANMASSRSDARVPLANMSHAEGDYYQFVWNEGDEPHRSKTKTSARDRVAKILRETELASSKKTKQYSYDDEVYDADEHISFRKADVSLSPGLKINPGSRRGAEDGFVALKGQPSVVKDELYDGWDYDDIEDEPTVLSRSQGDGHSDPSLATSEEIPKSANYDKDMQMRLRRLSSEQDGDKSSLRSEGNEVASPQNAEGSYSRQTPLPLTQVSSKVDAYLPMDSLAELTMDSGDDEAILDLTQDMEHDFPDTQPIVDQAALNEQWILKKRRKQMIAVMAVSIVVGLSALGTITYLVVHYLTNW